MDHVEIQEEKKKKKGKKPQGRAEEYDLWDLWPTLRSLSLALTKGRKDRNKPYPLLYSIINILEGGMEGLLLKLLKIIYSDYILQPLRAQSKDTAGSLPAFTDNPLCVQVSR